eukprot:CAMPEP_0174233362 /NCGR_PEP_ID=MMETSP0417-20130205/3425_1 /TAXON_ID=242541 /ORGANISM="Mayorella sp, Strain BSH-02190019" /LENGTH=42 /DNA_ID= /DNA_START= /DNA_END= /DNA_ORIENTATION=
MPPKLVRALIAKELAAPTVEPAPASAPLAVVLASRLESTPDV